MTKPRCYSKDYFKSEKQALLKIQQAMDNARDSCYLIDGQGRVVYANHAACKSLGYSQKQMFDLTIFDIDPGFTPEMLARHMSELAIKKTEILDSYHMTREGYIFPVELSINYLSDDREQFLSCAFARDISKRKAAQEAIEEYKTRLENKVEERTALLRLTAEISADFVAGSPETIRQTIEDALKRIGEFFTFDRVAFFSLKPELVGGDKILEWCAQGIESKVGILSPHPIIDKSLDQLVHYMEDEAVYHFPDVDKMSDRRGWRTALKKLGIESALFLPSRTDKKVYGIVGFEMMTPRDRWPEDHINGLKVITQIFAHAVAGIESGRALIEANNSLEARVAQRTRELKEQVVQKVEAMKELAESQSSLVKASRAAGMAEVATNVLHNVGNVLNSINTSISVIQERLEKSRMANVQKVVDMLPTSQQDLADFLIHDPKGGQVLNYLTSLAGALKSERQAMQAEIKTLVHQVDHVKKVIVMQQCYGLVHGVKEPFVVGELVEDAIAMNRDRLEKHGITVERRFAQVPTIVTDKHQVLQIFVNLISNGINACIENKTGRRKERIIIITLNCDDQKYIEIQVKDNGTGIASENLSRIFQHGFTTRRYGHGFGLHSGALAAKQLGGSLTVQSAGLGKGAAFTLALPLSAPEAS